MSEGNTTKTVGSGFDGKLAADFKARTIARLRAERQPQRRSWLSRLLSYFKRKARTE